MMDDLQATLLTGETLTRLSTQIRSTQVRAFDYRVFDDIYGTKLDMSKHNPVRTYALSSKSPTREALNSGSAGQRVKD